jgi:hypothetical protein
MSVISVIITPSCDQTIEGIPNTVSVETNEPSTIFYTLDGTVPNTFSSIYVAPIIFPQSQLQVVLNVFATNGVDSSAVITAEYCGNPLSIETMVGDRLAHAAVSGVDNGAMLNSLFPYGTNSPNPTFEYLNVGDAGITVYNEDRPARSNGFDGQGHPTAYTNKPIGYFKFKQIYSTTNSEGEVFPGVGNLPAKTTVIGKQSPVEYMPEISSAADKIFNPRALVVYTDSSTDDPTNPTIINSQYFSLETPEIVRDGALLYSVGLDNPTITGSYLKSYYNNRTQELTSYFYDNNVGRWIISTSPYVPTNPTVGQLYHMSFPRQKGAQGKVFSWIPFTRRVLM